MHTYFLSDDDVRRYACDLAARLDALGEAMPTVWFTLGISGDKMGAVLGQALLESRRDSLDTYRLSYNRKDGTCTVRGEAFPQITARTVLLIDSAIHSGASMEAAVRTLREHGAQNIITYSLIIKRTSSFVPSYFGLVIDEHDRAYFQLEVLPNNRLHKAAPVGTLRKVRNADAHRQDRKLDTGVPSIDGITLGDLYYECHTKGSHAYLYEVDGKLAGVLHFKFTAQNTLFIDLVATDQAYRGQSLGIALMRWAETYARVSKCSAIELWAIEDRVSFYEHQGFTRTTDVPLDLGFGEIYHRMRKPILYNVKPSELADLHPHPLSALAG